MKVSAMTALASLMAGLALSVSAAYAWSAGYLYRYVNEEGVTVINYSIPPHFVQKGYEILNRDGSVHKVVPRTLSEEELASQSSDAYKERVAAEEAERLRKWDESLLIRYSSIEDIEAARDRSLGEIRIRLNILESNLRSYKSQVERNQERAANLERDGRKVPVELVSAIDGLRDEIAETERAIEDRRRELEVVDEGYARDIERFHLLAEKVELRRQLSRSD